MRLNKIALLTLGLTLAVGVYGTYEATAAADEIEIIELNLAYEPEELEAHVGQTVRLTNRDPFFHQTRVTFLNLEGQPQEIIVNDKIEKKNTSQVFTPQHKGEYQIRCMVHDGMEATLYVN